MAGIIAGDPDSVYSTIQQGDSSVSKLSALMAFSEKDINGLEIYSDYFGTDFSGILEAYSLLNDLVPGVSAKNAVSMWMVF